MATRQMLGGQRSVAGQEFADVAEDFALRLMTLTPFTVVTQSNDRESSSHPVVVIEHRECHCNVLVSTFKAEQKKKGGGFKKR